MSVRAGARPSDRRSSARRIPASSPATPLASSTPAQPRSAQPPSVEAPPWQPRSVEPPEVGAPAALVPSALLAASAQTPASQPHSTLSGTSAEASGAQELSVAAGATATSAPGGDNPFSARVRERFGRRASRYAEQARLQRGVAWRLAHLCRDLPLLPGPCADLGAGTGLLSQALRQQRPNLRILQLDLCQELLARNPLAENGDGALVWDLNRGLPPDLPPAALLASSFALQWLEDPTMQLRHWCAQPRQGGWLALAVPTAGSLRSWRQAAQAAAVPCTALPLPSARHLIAVAAEGLELHRCQTLRFTTSAPDGRQALGRIGALGAGASRAPRLRPAQLRRLLDHWPQHPAWCWEVLLLLGRRR